MTETTTIRNFPLHRYKHGKLKEAIQLPQFTELLDRIDALSTTPFHYLKKYDLLTVKSLLSAYYWLGVRKTELIGSKSKRYVCPPCTRRQHPITKTSPAIPGVLKEGIKVEGEWLCITAPPRKKGSRDAPLELPLSFPYVNLIFQQWQKTEPQHRVWPMTEWDIWKIVKECNPHLYLHFFRFNRITELCTNPTISLGEICSWTGLTPLTVNDYMERSGRLIKTAAAKMKLQYTT